MSQGKVRYVGQKDVSVRGSVRAAAGAALDSGADSRGALSALRGRSAADPVVPQRTGSATVAEEPGALDGAHLPGQPYRVRVYKLQSWEQFAKGLSAFIPGRPPVKKPWAVEVVFYGHKRYPIAGFRTYEQACDRARRWVKFFEIVSGRDGSAGMDSRPKVGAARD